MPTIITTIVLIIAFVILCPKVMFRIFCWCIVLPIDFIKYRKSQYYQDTQEKYSFLCGSSYWIAFYEAVKKENLPISYYRCRDGTTAGFGYFVYKDTLITNSAEPCHYDADEGVWLVEIEDEYIDIKSEVDSEIDGCNKFLGSEICKKAIVLVDEDFYEEDVNVNYENIELFPYNKKHLAEALKNLVYQTGSN